MGGGGGQARETGIAVRGRKVPGLAGFPSYGCCSSGPCSSSVPSWTAALAQPSRIYLRQVNWGKRELNIFLGVQGLSHLAATIKNLSEKTSFFSAGFAHRQSG